MLIERNLIQVQKRKQLFANLFSELLLVCTFLTYGSKDDVYDTYRKAAITTNSKRCANIGRIIMQQGGSIADVAIATLLCGGVRNPERMGLGGGFLMTIYHRASKKVECLIARETAPRASTADMYKQNTDLSLYGGLAVAVPGEIKGYWELHKRYGKLPWEKLFEPSIDLSRHGVEVEPYTKIGLQEVGKSIMKSSTLRLILTDARTGKILQSDKQKIYRSTLAKTLELIAKFGPDVLYNGELSDGLVKDIRNAGGIITREDLINYQPRWVKPVSMQLPGYYTAYSVPPPGSGAVLLLILNTIAKCMPFKDHFDYCYKIVEAWKFAYGYRSKFGDSDFVKGIPNIIEEMLSQKTVDYITEKILKKETSNDFRAYGGDFYAKCDGGTAHYNFIHVNGDAISWTGTINELFGAKFRSVSTGIILNNSMNDFSLPDVENNFGLPPSKHNMIEPNKIPMSSMCPTLVIDENGDVRMSIGAAGGTKIISSISMVVANHLWLKMNLNTAVNNLRLHHQLMPMKVQYEEGFEEGILYYLQSKGHQLHKMNRLSTVSVIVREEDGLLHAKGDPRRPSATSGF